MVATDLNIASTSFKGNDAIFIQLLATAVVTETPLGMRPGMTCELAFVINLGKVQKIHRRIARVVHVSNGMTGFLMDKFEEK